ncbi:hypothetical protein V8E53_012377 [Lactarius tabidus]
MHASAPQTKTFLQKWFPEEFNQAILNLEAQQTLLCLCSAHWKAKAMFSLILLQQNKGGDKGSANAIPPDSSNITSSQFPEPLQTTLILQVHGMAPANTAKHTFECSPGPKSPSASQAQKHSKDDTVPTGWKTASSQGPSDNINQHPAPHRVVPSFLSRTEVISLETVPTSVHPIHVDPSGILTSDFPSLTTAPNLLRSMNMHRLFQQGKTSENVTTLLECLQSADPGSLDLNEDNTGKGWGHYQFTDVSSIATAFKLMAAAIKTCQEAWLICKNARILLKGFISDAYLEKTLEFLEKCWVDAGGILSQCLYPVIPTTPPSYSDVVMVSISPPKPGFKIKFKPLADSANILEVPAGTSSTCQQPANSIEPSATLDQGPSLIHSLQDACTVAALLKSLHTVELQAWISGHRLSMPKWKHKDDLIAAIAKSSQFTQVTKASIDEIIEKHKQKKSSAT